MSFKLKLKITNELSLYIIKSKAYKNWRFNAYLQGLSNNLYPEPNQSIPSIDTHNFKIHSNIVLPSKSRPSRDFFTVVLHVTIFKAV